MLVGQTPPKASRQPGRATAAIRLQALGPAHLRVNVDSEQPGIVIVAENWMPGWRVENAACGATPGACDGSGAPVLNLPVLAPVRADLALIGVPVPVGGGTI